MSDKIRSDNGPEFAAHRVREWLERIELKTLSIEPGSPWQNGCVESFYGKMHCQPLDREEGSASTKNSALDPYRRLEPR